MTRHHPVGYPNSNRRKRLLNDLYWKACSLCHWCSCRTEIGKIGSKQQATIDHLKTIRQDRKDYWEGGHVLACYECNQKRSHEENLELHRNAMSVKNITIDPFSYFLGWDREKLPILD